MEGCCPNTPVEVPPKTAEPKELPKGEGANGLLLVALLACPKTDDPNGLLEEDCPKGLVEPNIAADQQEVCQSPNLAKLRLLLLAKDESQKSFAS